MAAIQLPAIELEVQSWERVHGRIDELVDYRASLVHARGAASAAEAEDIDATIADVDRRIEQHRETQARLMAERDALTRAERARAVDAAQLPAELLYEAALPVEREIVAAVDRLRAVRKLHVEGANLRHPLTEAQRRVFELADQLREELSGGQWAHEATAYRKNLERRRAEAAPTGPVDRMAGAMLAVES